MFWKKKNLDTGALGEEIAVKYLKKKGYKILECNFSNKVGRRVGEIDIICRKDELVIFVEVKTREMKAGQVLIPEENITEQKLRKIVKAAGFYLRKNRMMDADWRVDAVSILIDGSTKNAKVRHLESIFI